MRVAWVHPTWRDLVIETTSRDDRARRRFLRNCGAHGAILALAIGGGAEGEREFPLLRTDEDWDLIGDRLYELAPELEVAELAAVLSALDQAVRRGRGVRAGETEASELCRVVLERVALVWDRARAPIELIVLEPWLELSWRLAPPVRPPEAMLATTWAELVPVGWISPNDRAEVRRLTDWLSLCAALTRFDHSLPGRLGFGDDQRALLQAFVDEIEAAPRGSMGDHVLAALAGISRVAPDLAAPELRGAAYRAEYRLQAELPAAGDVLVPGVGWRPEPIADPEHEFDVARVLSDL